MMTKDINDETYWADILEKFDSYEGTIIDFCKENNANHLQLYYRRKRTRK